MISKRVCERVFSFKVTNFYDVCKLKDSNKVAKKSLIVFNLLKIFYPFSGKNH